MRSMIIFLFSILFSANAYSQQERLSEYPGGEKAFEKYIIKGITLPDTVNTEVYSFQLNIYANDKKIELADSYTWFSNKETLDYQFLELIKKMPKWEIKDTTIECIQIKGSLSFFPDEGTTLKLKRTNISNLTTITDILAHHATNRDEDESPVDTSELIEEELVVVMEEEPAKDGIKPDFALEQEPLFPGGEKAFEKYIKKHLKYPKRNKVQKIKGEVILRFFIDETGLISNICIKKSIDYDYDMEAVKLVENMPKWNPGRQNGKAVPAYHTLPIVF